MNSKVLVKIVVFSIEKEFDCFLPINEKIYNIKKIIIKYLFDNSISEDEYNKYALINGRTSRIYNNNDRIGNTDIRNGTEIIILKTTN